MGEGAINPDWLVRVGASGLTEQGLDEILPAEFRALLSGAEKREYLDRWAETELLYQAALDRNLDADPQLLARLYQQEREFLANQVLQRVLAERVIVTEDEVSAFYTEHLDQYASEYRYREIIVSTSEEAEELQASLTDGSLSFRRAAEKHSLSASARGGGDMGWLGFSSLLPQVAERLAAMDKSDVSPPFETAWGWSLIQLTDKRKSRQALDLNEVRDEIIRQLTMERRRRVYAGFMAELKESHRVDYHPDLEQVLKNDAWPASGTGGR